MSDESYEVGKVSGVLLVLLLPLWPERSRERMQLGRCTMSRRVCDDIEMDDEEDDEEEGGVGDDKYSSTTPQRHRLVHSRRG